MNTINQRRSQNIKIWLFVILAAGLLFAGVFILGQKQNMFGSTFMVSALFKDVKGLQAGNEVRYLGINVGTVKRIVFLSDTIVRVDMDIQSQTRTFIKQDAVASIGSEDLLGNKVINLESRGTTQAPIQADQVIPSGAKDPMEEAVQKALAAGDQITGLSADTRNLVQDIRKGKGPVGSLIQDSLMAQELRQGIQELHRTFRQTALAATQLNGMLQDIRAGKGAAGKLVADPVMADRLTDAVTQLQASATDIRQASGELENLTRHMQGGAVQTLLTDTAFAQNLSGSMEQIRKGTERFQENMEALKSNFLFRRYYKRQKKQLEQSRSRESGARSDSLTEGVNGSLRGM